MQVVVVASDEDAFVVGGIFAVGLGRLGLVVDERAHVRQLFTDVADECVELVPVVGLDGTVENHL